MELNKKKKRIILYSARYLVVGIQENESDHHKVIWCPADDESGDNDNRNLSAIKTTFNVIKFVRSEKRDSINSISSFTAISFLPF